MKENGNSPGEIRKKGSVVQRFKENLLILREYDDYYDDVPFKSKEETLPDLISNPNKALDAPNFINTDNLRIIFHHLTLDPDSLFDAWNKTCYDNSKGESKKREQQNRMYLLNFRNLCALESQRPGSAKVLFDEFGIKDFGRYHPATLIDQYDTKDNREDPYGIAFFPRDDYNGVFYCDLLRWDDAPLYRIYEVESRGDLMRKLIKANRRYGPDEKDGHKISFGLAFAHGTNSSMRINDGSDGTLTTGNPFFEYPQYAEYLTKIFEKNATFVLSSCSTGVEDGFAHQLAHVMDFTVISPDKDTGVPNKLDIEEKEGEIIFDVEYPEAATKIYTAKDPITHRILPYGEIPTERADLEIKLEPYSFPDKI